MITYYYTRTALSQAPVAGQILSYFAKQVNWADK
jgi:hypothetical protein